ncbi:MULTISPECIES: hypothetical protein [Dictyoglomus]|jgi:heme/copper-type cytochrome/quinol oxidase subunit 2|uniref:Uncharacterized protein n=1 Tax=Dictyoglomus turgidum (strain DSM 6724 / Z-1310) TaxID=515635 RepID=B8E2W0_DICTD|nr:MULTISPECIES: hypothetical protein [Dictyoglomus]ACK42460.1 conserved hypothetical protein [Dictyoglomus turgidum DSM 6724]HBU32084.1 hypothetical protein [Dictyoglomus sp.]
MEIKNIDKVLLIISIAIFIVILIFKIFSIRNFNEYTSPKEMKERVEKDINLEIESTVKSTNTLNINNTPEKGPYPPFVEFVE